MGTQIFGDQLSMKTKFVVDHLSKGINFMEIICSGGQSNGFGTKCVATVSQIRIEQVLEYYKVYYYIFFRLLDGDQEDQLCLFHLLPLFMVILGPQNGWNTICQN